ncbi:MAG: DUF6114 domain-containing protein [Nitrososphaerales archaeon]
MAKIENVKSGFGLASGLSLSGGVLIVLASVTSLIWHAAFTQMGGMVGMQRWMFGSGFTAMIFGISAIGIVSGGLIILGAIMMNRKPEENNRWGVIVLVFSVISFMGTGGFFIGAVLGIIGGILAVVKH